MNKFKTPWRYKYCEGQASSHFLLYKISQWSLEIPWSLHQNSQIWPRRRIFSNDFATYLSGKAIAFERAPSETPEQNPVPENFNRSLLERVWAIMNDTALPQHVWGEITIAVSTDLNLFPSSTLDMNTSHNLWLANSVGSHASTLQLVPGWPVISHSLARIVHTITKWTEAL